MLNSGKIYSFYDKTQFKNVKVTLHKTEKDKMETQEETQNNEINTSVEKRYEQYRKTGENSKTLADFLNESEQVNIADVSKNSINKKLEIKYFDLVSRGLGQSEIKEYFTFQTPIDLNTKCILKENLSLNGNCIKTVDDLIYELCNAPIDKICLKAKAGIISADDVENELEQIGASNIITNDNSINFIYRGRRYTINSKDIEKGEEPLNTKSNFEKPISKSALRRMGFSTGDINKFFKEVSVTSLKSNAFEKNNEKKFLLKDNIVINGIQINSVYALQYYYVFNNLNK